MSLIGEMFIALLLLVAIIGALAYLPQIDGNQSLFFGAPTQIVLGSSAVLVLLLLFVLGFRRMGITDTSQALGLPEGSIRALIAVLLIVIFCILANIIFGVFQGSESNFGFRDIPATDVATMQADERSDVVITGSRTVTQAGEEVQLISGNVLRSRTSNSAEQVGFQLLTALVTLVTAVSAFYFGSGSVRTATNAATMARRGDTGRLSVRRPRGLPVSLRRSGGTWEPVRISFDRDGVEFVALVGDEAGSVTWDEADVAFLYRPGQPEATGELRFEIPGERGATARVPFRREMAPTAEANAAGAGEQRPPDGDLGTGSATGPGNVGTTHESNDPPLPESGGQHAGDALPGGQAEAEEL